MKVLSVTVGLLPAIAWVQQPGGAKKDEAQDSDWRSDFLFKVTVSNTEHENCCSLFIVCFILCVFWYSELFFKANHWLTIQTYSLDFAQLSWWYLSCHVCHRDRQVTMTTGQTPSSEEDCVVWLNALEKPVSGSLVKYSNINIVNICQCQGWINNWAKGPQNQGLLCALRSLVIWLIKHLWGNLHHWGPVSTKWATLVGSIM